MLRKPKESVFVPKSILQSIERHSNRNLRSERSNKFLEKILGQRNLSVGSYSQRSTVSHGLTKRNKKSGSRSFRKSMTKTHNDSDSDQKLSKKQKGSH